VFVRRKNPLTADDMEEVMVEALASFLRFKMKIYSRVSRNSLNSREPLTWKKGVRSGHSTSPSIKASAKPCTEA